MNSPLASINICRTCSVQSKNEIYTPLYVGPTSCKALRGIVLTELIAFGLKIVEGDGLPQEICSRCLDNFSFIVQFREQCKHAQEVLKAMFEQNCSTNSDIIITDSIFQTSMTLQEDDSVLPKIEEVCLVIPSCVKEAECDPSNDAKENTAGDSRRRNLSKLGSPNMVDNTSDSESVGSHHKVPTEEKSIKIPRSNGLKKTFNEEQRKRSEVLCKYCDETFKTARGLLIHKQKCDAYNEVYCQICTSEFETKEQLESHIQESHSSGGNAQFPCFVCNKEFKSNKYLTLHINRFHSGTSECKICYKKFDNVDKLRYHWNYEHIENMKYKCKYCDKLFATKSIMLNHERSHTGDRPFLCSQCGAGFRQRSKLVEHMKTHDEQQSFGCEVCGLIFSTDRQLKYHRGKHITKKHKCEVCGESFSYKLELYTHRYNEHNVSKIIPKRQVDYPFKCPQCNKGFLVLSSLSNHLRMHMDNERKHVCPHCGNGYKRSDHLNLHIKRMHLKVYEHKCNICGKEYLEKCQLKAHMIVHDSARPFNCTKCPASFKRQRALKDHMHKHEGKKEYACEICDMRFFNRTVVVLHTQRVHLDSQKKFMSELIRNEVEDAKSFMEEDYESAQIFS